MRRTNRQSPVKRQTRQSFAVASGCPAGEPVDRFQDFAAPGARDPDLLAGQQVLKERIETRETRAGVLALSGPMILAAEDDPVALRPRVDAEIMIGLQRVLIQAFRQRAARDLRFEHVALSASRLHDACFFAGIRNDLGMLEHLRAEGGRPFRKRREVFQRVEFRLRFDLEVPLRGEPKRIAAEADVESESLCQ